MGRAGFYVRVVVVFDVQPADAGLHDMVLFDALGSGKSLAGDVRPVEDGDHGRVVDAPMEFRQELTSLPDQVGFDFQAKG